MLLDADPLEDIAHTRAVHSVIYDGSVYTREDLDGMLEYVESNASSLQLVSRSLWTTLKE